VEATQFTSRLSGILNVPVSTQTTASNQGLRIGAWNAKSTWYSTTDTASLALPTVNDTVTISTGDSIYVNAVSYCKVLIVNGVLYTANNIMNVNGDLTVNTSGICGINKQVYTKNTFNYGKIWAPGKTNSSTTTTVALYVGYTCTGATATASTDSCTIVNDGVLGWYRTAAAGGVAKGCGLFIYYPNIVKAVNITHTPGVTNYAFTALTILPVVISGSTPAQDVNLYFNESAAFVATGSGQPFSLHANDAFPITLKRTCTVAAGDTVFVAGYFHKNSAPSVLQGQMIYNIYGCLDLGSYRQTKNEFDIYTLAGNGAVTVNIGDGTQPNAGTLVLGAAVNLNAVSAGMIVINTRPYSTVKFGYKAAPTIACTVAGVADNSLFPSSFYNLTVNNTGGITLPAGINVNVSNALTLSTGTLTLGTSNITAGSISGGSATSYVVTNGTGTLTVPAAATIATLLPIGASASSYDPVTVTPATTSNFSAKVSGTLSGTVATTKYSNAKEWTVTPATASSTLLSLKPSNEDAGVASAIGISPAVAYVGQANGSAAYNYLSAGYSTGTYSATVTSFSSFITGTTKPATFTSRLSAISGVPVSTQTTASNSGLRIGAWNAKSTWYDPAVVDTSTVSLPTILDDVTISAGDSIYVNAASYCHTLSLNGVLCTSNNVMNVNGNLTVNPTGIFSVIKQVYTKNTYNYGKIWASGKTNSNTTTTVALYVGYTCTGTTAAASTDSCTILNDGVLGWYRAAAAGGTAKGCGVFIYYPNIAKAVNITHTPGVTNYAFTALTILPVAISGSTPSQDLNLYFNESVAFVAAGSGQPFSLHANDAFPITLKRTCTIAAGDTVFVAGYFHKNSAPSVVQGQMIYNIYGCLDLGSYRQTKNEFDIYTLAGNGGVTVNIGDGTQPNAGTLVLGAAVNLNAVSAGMIVINPRTYSTLKFGYKAAPTIACTVAGVADNSLFPSSLYNLTINNTGGVTLPAGLNVNVSSALTLSLGNLTLGTTNLTAGSISGGSATSYIVTNGTGKITQTATTSGTLFPIGVAAAYAPVTITPASNDMVSASVSATTTGTFAGYAVNANEWTLTPQVATTAALAFTPATATNTTAPAIFSGAGYAAKTDATLTGSTYSATGINLDALATIFATGGTTPATAIATGTANDLLIYAANKSLFIKNAKLGDLVTVYGINGSKVAASVVKDNNTTMILNSGLYIVKTGSTVQKVVIQ
jgi:hypothetical protein